MRDDRFEVFLFPCANEEDTRKLKMIEKVVVGISWGRSRPPRAVLPAVESVTQPECRRFVWDPRGGRRAVREIRAHPPLAVCPLGGERFHCIEYIAFEPGASRTPCISPAERVLVPTTRSQANTQRLSFTDTDVGEGCVPRSRYKTKTTTAIHPWEE